MIENSAQKSGYRQITSNYKGVGRLFENIAQNILPVKTPHLEDFNDQSNALGSNQPQGNVAKRIFNY
jgi:hypothetical protein